jgi:chemotaxis-related protein WspD
MTLHDCWNQVGVQGDRSCAELARHLHCRNCPSYLAAARTQLARPVAAEDIAAWTEQFSKPTVRQETQKHSVLIVRCGSEWLGLHTRLCGEVTGHRTIRTLPHRRSAAILGLANVRGALIPCVSLSKLLGIHEDAPPASPRLVVVADESHSTAVQVDEVVGTHRYSSNELRPVPDTLPVGDDRRIEAILLTRDRSVGILGAKALVDSLARCLA